MEFSLFLHSVLKEEATGMFNEAIEQFNVKNV